MVKFPYIATEENLANKLTKLLGSTKFDIFSRSIVGESSRE